MFHKPTPAEQAWQKMGIDSQHFKSCGPQSLSELHEHFGEKKLPQVVSIDLQHNRCVNIFKLLGLVETEFRRITCPVELRAYLKRHGFEYERVNYEDLQQGDFAIVLLKGYDDLHEWHWATWPNDKEDIPTFFDDYTKIVKTYKITKVN